ncbi:uncharacterized protein RJT21DRAFT_119224 [Scheffersomyces amazonensis]|uniref:uncharacterized protein n=1 Tax=Scheffersomyces amazonensis TaxID=1078765 RepID=UPI00315CFD07
MSKVTVIGAGIIGLYTTYLLTERGIEGKNIKIVAEFLPGDQSIKYASPYAGAYFSACIDEEHLPYSRYTYENLDKLKAKLGPTPGIGNVYSTEYLDEIPDDSYLAKIKDFVEDYELVEPPAYLKTAKVGVRYKAFVFNSPLLISNLLEYLKSIGVTVERKKINHINDAFKENDADLVFNCSGTGSMTLGGVEDPKSFPTRGQVVVIRAPHIKECVSLWDDASTYIIKRPDSINHEVILGGFYQAGNFDANTYGFETEDILRRTTQLFPKLLEDNETGNTIKDLQILRVVAGARPGREGGVRIEKEVTNTGTIVHNYGASGSGYLCGLGMSSKAVDLVIKS